MNKKNAVATVPAKKSLLAKVAEKFSVEPTVLQATLKETVFKGASDAQTVALLVVSDQYGLNPFTREIYAFPAKNGGIVPVVGIDGWLRIINQHPQYDGMKITDDDEFCTCEIFRKDRQHPTIATEYLSECKRNTDVWNMMPKRMLRHKAIIQCARIAFSFVGIYDEDEAKKIAEAAFEEIKEPIPLPVETKEESNELMLSEQQALDIAMELPKYQGASQETILKYYSGLLKREITDLIDIPEKHYIEIMAMIRKHKPVEKAS